MLSKYVVRPTAKCVIYLAIIVIVENVKNTISTVRYNVDLSLIGSLHVSETALMVEKISVGLQDIEKQS